MYSLGRAKKNAFSWEEKQLIVNLLLEFADRGSPMKRIHLIEAASLVIKNLSPERRASLQFLSGRPGKEWVHKLYHRHKESSKSDPKKETDLQ